MMDQSLDLSNFAFVVQDVIERDGAPCYRIRARSKRDGEFVTVGFLDLQLDEWRRLRAVLSAHQEADGSISA